MKKLFLISTALLFVANATFAGDYLTNTNQHAAFLRNVARGASIDIDGVYSNPAGLSFLDHDGFYLSLTGQSAFQTREITSSYKTYAMGQNGKPTAIDQNEFYKGTASAPIIPSFQGVYKRDRWTISASFAITGGGGKASFDNGLPMFNSIVKASIFQKTHGALNSSMYDINTSMDGKQYIFGIQLGFGYKITDWVSAFVGGRMNYVSSGYEGYLTANLKTAIPQLDMKKGHELTSIGLDCDQSGWGMTPIIGLDFKLNKVNFGIKYEFVTNLNIENKTNRLVVPEGMENSDLIKAYADGEQTPNDLPAMLSLAVQYSPIKTLRLSAEYHFFDDKHAGMLNDRQRTLKHGTHEYLAGVEWDVHRRLTISGGMQRTNYGLSDEFQTDTSFYCDSYSAGFGARINFNKGWSMDLAYFWTMYDKYTKTSENYNNTGTKELPLPGTDIYYRTNKTFGLSLNYKF